MDEGFCHPSRIVFTPGCDRSRLKATFCDIVLDSALTLKLRRLVANRVDYRIGHFEDGEVSGRTGQK